MIYGQVPLITGVFRGLALAGAAGVAHVGIAAIAMWLSACAGKSVAGWLHSESGRKD